jgi:competence protein ComEC
LLSAAFVMQLLLDPDSARSLSFILSYLALFGIAVLGAAADDLLSPFLPGSFRTAVAASIGAFLATAAVSAAAFGTLRPVGIVAGLLVAPAASALMIGGLVWFALDVVAPPLAAAVQPVVALVAEVGERTVDLASRVRGLATPTYASVLIASLAISALLVYGRYRLERTRNRVDPFD